MPRAYIGVDVGTTSTRAGVFDEAGTLLATARHPLPGQVRRHVGSRDGDRVPVRALGTCAPCRARHEGARGHERVVTANRDAA